MYREDSNMMKGTLIAEVQVCNTNARNVTTPIYTNARYIDCRGPKDPISTSLPFATGAFKCWSKVCPKGCFSIVIIHLPTKVKHNETAAELTILFFQAQL